MAFLRHLDVKGRLWIALALLTLSTISVGVIGWYSLDRADSHIQILHRQTLAQVAQSLELSKQSSGIATSAPFLLNYRSQYLIDREGNALIETLEHVESNWPSLRDGTSSAVYAFETEITDAIGRMRKAVEDLIGAANGQNEERNVTQGRLEEIRKLEREFYGRSTDPDLAASSRQTWFSLQAMSNALSGAAHSKNLLGVGEYHRRYEALLARMMEASLSAEPEGFVSELEDMAEGAQGLFEIRRRELTHRLDAQNALFRIRQQAVYISDLSARFAKNAEDFLSRGRLETSSQLNVTKVLIVFSGLVSISIALASAFFVSRYITANIEAITDAMARLAQGDRSSKLTLKISANDEIAKLIQSFRMFRANTLRLDRSNRQLNRKNALFERVFDNITDGVAITSDEGHMEAVNASFRTVLKLPAHQPLRNKTLEEVLSNSVFAADMHKFDGQQGLGAFSNLVGSDGSIVEMRYSPLADGGGVWLFSDATERRKVEERLTQIRHIEGLGKVSGEVAHDFGNILSSITANIHLFEQHSRDETSAKFVDRISNATEMGTSLVQRLLAFARKQALSPELVDLNFLIDGLSDLIGIGLKDEVELEINLGSEALIAKVDPGQMENAILNLCLNSNQAIDGVGKITLTTKRDAHGNAVIEVSDNGVGMNESIQERAFEPFYSDRSDGSSGTGLGLAMVYGFIKQSGGDIEIESAPNKGTAIRMILPPIAEDTVSEPLPAGLCRALVIEDDATDRQAALRILGNLGIEAHSVANYEEAEKAIRSDLSFDLLLSDLHLDNGKEAWPLVQLCLDQRDGTDIIVVSGHMPKHHPFSKQRDDSPVLCLAKPLSEDLMRDVIAREESRVG